MTRNAKQVALGGILSALCLVIMSLGTMIPVNTYLCPVLCILAIEVMLKQCGKRMALCCYGAVAILGLIMAPDKEAAVVFAFLGYYPSLKPVLDRIGNRILRVGAKVLLFSGAAVIAYGIISMVLGLPIEELMDMTPMLLVLFLGMWNAMFLAVDLLLSRMWMFGRRR